MRITDPFKALIILSIAASTVTSCSILMAEATETPEFPFPVISARGVWPLAVEEALRWREDSYPVDLSVNFDHENSQGVFNTVDFGFEAMGNEDETLWVICGYRACFSEVIEEPESPLYGESEPISLEDFKLDAKEALAISLNHGGRDFIPIMQERYISAFAKLTRLNPVHTGEVYWRVSYLEPATRDHLDVIIDANTGEVVEVRE